LTLLNVNGLPPPSECTIGDDVVSVVVYTGVPPSPVDVAGTVMSFAINVIDCSHTPLDTDRVPDVALHPLICWKYSVPPKL